jgi:hypothetical protein
MHLRPPQLYYSLSRRCLSTNGVIVDVLLQTVKLTRPDRDWSSPQPKQNKPTPPRPQLGTAAAIPDFVAAYVILSNILPNGLERCSQRHISCHRASNLSEEILDVSTN